MVETEAGLRIPGSVLPIRRCGVILALAGILAGCGGSSPSAAIEPTGPGTLSVSIKGLPGFVPAAVSVTGPNGFSRTLQWSGSLEGLAPGSYAVAAQPVTSGGMTYEPSPAAQTSSVSSAATVTASVTYEQSSEPTEFNLTIAAMYLTQATQRLDGSVPLVAGRPAFLRVFVVANQTDVPVQPQVRVQFFQGSLLIHSAIIPAPGDPYVPGEVDESRLSASWNLPVGAGLVQPGLRIVAEVDPAGDIPELTKSDNVFPRDEAATADIRSLPRFNLRFVPVRQQVNGLQGDVTTANQENFLAEAKDVLPIGDYDAGLRVPYTTTAPALEPDNGNGAWTTILNELRALRAAEGVQGYYYGVVRTSYTSGFAGFGYVGGSSRTAMGWDRFPTAAGILAHEVGHNMGRAHAPCGSPSAPDGNFPYPGGSIGVWGIDLTPLALKPPTTADFMGYCSPDWVSDYSWTGMMSYRASGANTAAEAGAEGQGLLIWGRIGPAGLVLEPAFLVPASAANAASGGPYRVELFDQANRVLRSVAFEAEEVADLEGERQFAFVVPVDDPPAVASIRVRADQRSVLRRAAVSPGTDAEPRAERRGANGVALHWNAGRYPMVMIRDSASGEILSLARNGSVVLETGGPALDLQFSDGVRTLSRRGVRAP